MIIGRFCMLLAEYEPSTFVFGITIGYIEQIPAHGLILNLGAGGIVFGWKTDE